MPDNLRAAHERNDEILERIYIGRRFKNDTKRLEKLFELYSKMTRQAGLQKVIVAKYGRIIPFRSERPPIFELNLDEGILFELIFLLVPKL